MAAFILRKAMRPNRLGLAHNIPTRSRRLRYGAVKQSTGPQWISLQRKQSKACLLAYEKDVEEQAKAAMPLQVQLAKMQKDEEYRRLMAWWFDHDPQDQVEPRERGDDLLFKMTISMLYLVPWDAQKLFSRCHCSKRTC